MERLKHEGAPQERKSEMSPYIDAALTYKNQLALFESMHGEESFGHPADTIYAFSSFLRMQSEKVLESVQASQTGEPEKQKQEYHLEAAAAKLHEFNNANAEVLKRYAEILAEDEGSAALYIDIFPWLRGINEWAVKYTKKPKVSE
jgi:hypothetical protein